MSQPGQYSPTQSTLTLSQQSLPSLAALQSSSQTSQSGLIAGPALPTVKENHVDFILLAQFDIDKGSVIKMQYPKPTGVDEQYVLAIFFLSHIFS